MANYEELNKDSVSRRGFLTQMTAAGLGAAAATLFAKSATASGAPLLEIVNIPDDGRFPGIPGRNLTEKVLNYALTLEILEADIYRQALNFAAGKPLGTALSDDMSSYTLSIPAGSYLIDVVAGFAYLQEFAPVEAAHRDFLHAAIQSAGGRPVSPNPGGYHADFGSTLESTLMVIRTLEETGVRAYLGAAQFISDHKVTQTAATIYSTEAKHSAAINYALGLPIGPQKQRLDSQAVLKQHGDNNFEYWLTPEQVIAKASAFFA